MISTLVKIIILSVSIVLLSTSKLTANDVAYEYSLIIPCMDLSKNRVIPVQIDAVNKEELLVWIGYLTDVISPQDFITKVVSIDKHVTEDNLMRGVLQFEQFCKPIIKSLIDNGKEGYVVESHKDSKRT